MAHDRLFYAFKPWGEFIENPHLMPEIIIYPRQILTSAATSSRLWLTLIYGLALKVK